MAHVAQLWCTTRILSKRSSVVDTVNMPRLRTVVVATELPAPEEEVPTGTEEQPTVTYTLDNWRSVPFVEQKQLGWYQAQVGNDSLYVQHTSRCSATHPLRKYGATDSFTGKRESAERFRSVAHPLCSRRDHPRVHRSACRERRRRQVLARFRPANPEVSTGS